MRKEWTGPQEVCPRCGSQVGVTGDYLADHQGTNGRKCPERAQPIKGKRKVKRSVRAVSGGLPGLGRRT